MRAAQRIRVTGLVQGVGFRPFVWRLARELELGGWVRNDAQGVEIEAEGARPQLEALLTRLRRDAPPLARVDEILVGEASISGVNDFVIAESGGGLAATAIGHDTATCPDCLAEMFDPASRRWRHAFITCTHCGPRYTLSAGVPYDRARTSMAGFPLCADCAAEYGNPADRRFHAETTCCPACGPQLSFLDAGGIAIAGDPVTLALARLRAGEIVAIKGLGGFHLACDARNPEAVAKLRLRKQREEKPFALMAANAASLANWVEVSETSLALLAGAERPVVLLRKRGVADEVFPAVAPGVAWLGAMLPYTPLQWLLFHEAAGRPAGTAWMEAPQDLLLVMTSANPGGEPLVIGNEEAQQRLAGIADAFLIHDRDILIRCDDSVVMSRESSVESSGSFTHDSPLSTLDCIIPFRRARGYTPRPVKLARSGPPVLALGAGLKNTICVTRGDEAFVSQHVGDLDNGPACGFLEETVDHLLAVLQVRPEAVACDLHPDFHSTRHAWQLAEALGVPLIPVQHHHAHLAAVAAEHGVEGPLLGLALDGVGLGTDGGAWGGELLRLHGAGFDRLGHLAPLALPGGDRAAREPWRMAASVLHALGRGSEIAHRFAGQPAAGQIANVMDRQLNCPTTSSLGRVFDAAAGLLGVKETCSYEGQAAMLLEGLAEGAGTVASWEDGWAITPDGQLNLLPLLGRLAAWPASAGEGAARFHATLAPALVDWLSRAVNENGIHAVALGGGCFLNSILRRAVMNGLDKTFGSDLTVLSARQVPPNDGGISLGQAWVALNTLKE